MIVGEEIPDTIGMVKKMYGIVLNPDYDFHKSLLDQFDEKKFLTPKQIEGAKKVSGWNYYNKK